ncbi:MAG: hypothetical protein ACI4DR_01665 [Roseburia sp.]
MSKVIAIIENPDNCQSCVFGVCKYSLPLSEHTKGYYCQLLQPEERVVQDFDYDADVHLDNCPLRQVPEKREADPAIDNDIDWGLAEGWNDCIDEIVGNTRSE